MKRAIPLIIALALSSCVHQPPARERYPDILMSAYIAVDALENHPYAEAKHIGDTWTCKMDPGDPASMAPTLPECVRKASAERFREGLDQRVTY